MRLKLAGMTLAVVIASATAASQVWADDPLNIDGVPLPANTSPAAHQASPFAGTWIGTWGRVWKTILVVESVSSNGDAKVIYALGDNPAMQFKQSWHRYDGKVSDGTLTVHGKGFVVTYRLSRTERLKAVFNKGSGYAVLTQQKLATLAHSSKMVPWTLGETTRLKTHIEEDGQPVALETVLYKPKGKGPFPLAVINHGSTGSGKDSAIAKKTLSNDWLADFLNERGWIVAFPQRRGRGKSDGNYDEGISRDRSKGYTCRIKRSLAGAERALTDVRAAVVALQRRPDVSDKPVLIGGNSRGGALSIAYAGRFPRETHGAINFVGGWMGSRCKNAERINQTLFSQGGSYKRPTLWLYGKDDYFYSVAHSMKNFASFKRAGGRGEFLTFSVTGRNNGHWVMSIPHLWSEPLSQYLTALSGNK